MRGTRYVLLLGALGLALLIVLKSRPGGTGHKPAPGEGLVPEGVLDLRGRVARPVSRVHRPPRAKQQGGASSRFRFEAFLDKHAVCRGEENFINVRYEADDWTEKFLSPQIKIPGVEGRRFGERVPFRLQGATSAPLTVLVESPEEFQQIQIPPPDVLDCDEPVVVTLVVRRGLGSFSRVKVDAHWRSTDVATAEPFVPSEFEWSFGDGHREITNVPTVRHSYEDRVQDRERSQFVLSVAARDASGIEATGSAEVSLVNKGFLSVAFRNEVAILYSLGDSPEPAAADVDSGVDVWLYHGHRHEVEIESISMVEREWPRGAKKPLEHDAVELSVADTLGFTRLPARSSSPVRGLRGQKPQRRGLRRIYRLTGVTDDGKVARGRFEI